MGVDEGARVVVIVGKIVCSFVAVDIVRVDVDIRNGEVAEVVDMLVDVGLVGVAVTVASVVVVDTIVVDATEGLIIDVNDVIAVFLVVAVICVDVVICVAICEVSSAVCVSF